MRRIDVPSAAAVAPTPPAAGTEGFFTNGNPATGTPATEVPDWFLNMVQEELRAVVVAGGLTPSKTVWTQLRDALAVLYGGGGNLAANGWQRLPGGLIVQWGSIGWGAAALPDFGGSWSTYTPFLNLPIVWPIAFPNAVYSAVGNGSDGTGGNDGLEVAAVFGSVTLTGATARVYRLAGTNGGFDVGSLRYVALGR